MKRCNLASDVPDVAREVACYKFNYSAHSALSSAVFSPPPLPVFGMHLVGSLRICEQSRLFTILRSRKSLTQELPGSEPIRRGRHSQPDRGGIGHIDTLR